jgi:hypothetical protein
VWVDALVSDVSAAKCATGHVAESGAANLSERKDLASVPKPIEAVIFKEGQPCHPHPCATPLLDSLSLAS